MDKVCVKRFGALAADEGLAVNFTRQTITLYDSGVTSNGGNHRTGGWWRQRDGGALFRAHEPPTVELTTGSGSIQYRRKYWS